MKTSRVFGVLSVCLVLLLSAAAPADLFMYEGFDMALNEGDGIHGAAGATSFGWAGPYQIVGSYNDPEFRADSLVLDSTSLKTRGGSIAFFEDGGADTRVVRYFNEPLGEVDGTYYMSFLYSTGLGQVTFDLSNGDWNGNRFLTIGREWSNGPVTLVGYQPAGSVAFSQEIASAEEVHLFVLKFELGPDSDTISVYVDPDVYAAEPAEADASFTVDQFNVTNIRQNCFNTNAVGLLDEIRLGETFEDVTPANGAAYNLYPLDGEMGVPAGSLLQWHVGDDPNEFTGVGSWADVAGYYVYVGSGTDPNLYLQTPTALPATTTTFDAGLVKDTVYFWQVEEALEDGLGGLYGPGDANNVMSPVWMFETELTVPVIIQEPAAYTLAGLGDTVNLTVGVDSVSAAHFAWFYSADNAVSVDDTPVGTDSATLSLPNFQLSNDGYYYCVVSNSSGVNVTSALAQVELEKVMAWYKLNGDFADETGNFDASAWGTYSFEAGIVDSSSVYLVKDDGAISAPRSIENSFTIGLWVKTTDGATRACGLVSGSTSSTSHNHFDTIIRGSKFNFAVGGTPYVNLASATDINDDQWHYCVATRDMITGEMKLYVDGILEASAIGSTGKKNAPDSLRIGKSKWGNDYLVGYLDDVQLLNYPLSAEQVAQNYFDVTGQRVCIDGNPVGDISGNCVVDIEDLAMMAANWMVSGLYPAD